MCSESCVESTRSKSLETDCCEHIPLPHSVNQTGIEIYPKNREIKTTTKIKHNSPEIVAKIAEECQWQLIDIHIVQDLNIVTKKNESFNNYLDLPGAIMMENKVKAVIVPLVMGALGISSKWLKTCIDISIPNIIGCVEISINMRNASILKDVLSF